MKLSSSIEIVEVSTAKQRRDFIQVPWALYCNDPYWVPPLRVVVKKNLDTKKNPFYKQASLACWVAYRDHQPIGRIAGIINQRYMDTYSEKVGFFGFFECENNAELSQQLFNRVEDWARQQGMQFLQGPMNPSTNYECGLQISAFETKPFIMMTQNPNFYPVLVEQAGFKKIKDLQAWLLSNQNLNFHEKLIAKANLAIKKENITIRSINLSKYNEEVLALFEIYNDAWEKNWGFVPMTKEEFFSTCAELKSLLIPEWVLILEVNGEVAAFGICLPDINEVLLRIRSGRLFPVGLIKLYWHMKIRKTIKRGRVLALGVKQKYQHLHLGAVLYIQYAKMCNVLQTVECSWILEDNIPMQAGLQSMRAHHYKTYRLYQKSL